MSETSDAVSGFESRWFYFPLVTPFFWLLGIFLMVDRFQLVVNGFGAVLLLLGLVTNFLSFGTYYVETKRLRAVDASWTPNWILYVVGHLFIFPIFMGLIYTFQRWRHIGLSRTVDQSKAGEPDRRVYPLPNSDRARTGERIAGGLYALGVVLVLMTFFAAGYFWLTLDPSLETASRQSSVTSIGAFYVNYLQGVVKAFALLGTPFALVLLIENALADNRRRVEIGFAVGFLLIAGTLWQFTDALSLVPYLVVGFLFAVVAVGLPASWATRR